MARGDDLLSALRELPFLQQKAADDGVVDAEALGFAGDQRSLMDLLVVEALVEIGNRAVEGHQADVLYEAREKQLLDVLDADRAREHVARGRR